MKIVFISNWYSEGMGYAENMFPKALARLGHEVHLVTSTAQIYCYSPTYEKTYQSFLGPKFVEPGVKHIDGYTLHRLPYYTAKVLYQGPGLTGLYDYLKGLRPDVIQVFEILQDASYAAARYAHEHNCLFFTESHMHASVLQNSGSKAWKEWLKDRRNSFNSRLRFINDTTSRSYPIAEDVAGIAMSRYKVPADKIRVQSLGVDTQAFCPPETPDQRAAGEERRKAFGFTKDDIVCIYTGRFTRDKNPHCLAEAIDLLSGEGLPFKGLFVGNGPEEDIEYLRSMRGCQVGPFVKAKELPAFYWSADIGVWPREESTSQLDAAATGLPLILSDQIKVTERVDGNGLLYAEGNAPDLARALRALLDPAVRSRMSAIGISNVRERFSWESIARTRLKDYLSFLKP